MRSASKSKKVVTAQADVVTIATPKVEHPVAPPSAVSYKNAKVNPQTEAAINSPSQCAGASTVVTPIPMFVPRLQDIEFLAGVGKFFLEMIDPNGAWKRRHSTIVQRTSESIDMNEFIPTTYDDYSEWNVLPGSNVERST